MKSSELLRKLKKISRKRGVTLTVEPGKCSHYKVSLGEALTVIPHHAGAELAIGTLKSILKDLSFTERELYE